MVFDQVDDCMQTSVDCAAVIILVAEILPQRLFLVFCNVEGVPCQLIDSLVFDS